MHSRRVGLHQHVLRWWCVACGILTVQHAGKQVPCSCSGREQRSLAPSAQAFPLRTPQGLQLHGAAGQVHPTHQPGSGAAARRRGPALRTDAASRVGLEGPPGGAAHAPAAQGLLRRVGRGGFGGGAEQGCDQQDGRHAACPERAAAAGLHSGGAGLPLCGLRWRLSW